jgi:hypothetical protein
MRNFEKFRIAKFRIHPNRNSLKNVYLFETQLKKQTIINSLVIYGSATLQYMSKKETNRNSFKNGLFQFDNTMTKKEKIRRNSFKIGYVFGNTVSKHFKMVIYTVRQHYIKKGNE